MLQGCREGWLFSRSPTQNRMAQGATSGIHSPSIYSSHFCGLQQLKTLHPIFLVLQLAVWFTGGEQLSGEVKHQLVTRLVASYLPAMASHTPGLALSSVVCRAGKAGQLLPPHQQEDVQN